MSPLKKIFFALLSLLLFAAVIEGVASAIWFGMEQRVFAERFKRGEEQLRNDKINFLKQPDQVYGYSLRPGEKGPHQFVNAEGFAQRDSVSIARKSKALRVIAMGESTTHGHNVDTGNYPVYLKTILKEEAKDYAEVEMINAGVSGWISDQVALRAEHQTAAYKADLVILYTGFNDFQSYNPTLPVARESYFETLYGKNKNFIGSQLKSVILANAVYAAIARKINKKWHKLYPEQHKAPPIPESTSPSTYDIYKYYVASLDRMIAAFKKKNPSCQIALSTLVGRWPDGTLADYQSTNGAIWWMTQDNMSASEAAAYMENFNNLIRDYAKKNNILLIDAAQTFKNFDRAKLQWDFAHMHPEGYELLAETMYDQLRNLDIVKGLPRKRFQELSTKYKKPIL